MNRDSRSVTLTGQGETLLSYARRMLALNRELVSLFQNERVAGEVVLGAPDNIGDDVMPQVLRRLQESHPGVKVEVIIDFSRNLLRDVGAGKYDLVLYSCHHDTSTREPGEVIFTEPLVWAGLKGGTAFEKRPLPVAMLEATCVHSRMARDVLVEAGLDYTVAYQTQYVGAQKAAIRADMVVSPMGLSQVDKDLEVLTDIDGLPEIGDNRMGMVLKDKPSEAAQAVADYFRTTFSEVQNSRIFRMPRVA